MQRPRLIMHNTVSLDGAIAGFEVDMGLHYGIVRSYKPDFMLVGSRTARSSAELFMREVPGEREHDFHKHISENDPRPYFAVPDSQGTLKGVLHIYRQSEYCKEPIVFVSEQTPHDYLEYLQKRNYDYHVCGREKVDYLLLLDILAEQYGARTVVTNTGGTLNTLLLQQGVVDEISLVIAPILVDNTYPGLFRDLEAPGGIQLELKTSRVDRGHQILVYTVTGGIIGHTGGWPKGKFVR